MTWGDLMRTDPLELGDDGLRLALWLLRSCGYGHFFLDFDPEVKPEGVSDGNS